MCDGCALSTAYEDMFETPSSRGAHEKEKSASVIDYNKYKIGVSKLDQMLSYHLFQRKSVYW